MVAPPLNTVHASATPHQVEPATQKPVQYHIKSIERKSHACAPALTLCTQPHQACTPASHTLVTSMPMCPGSAVAPAAPRGNQLVVQHSSQQRRAQAQLLRERARLPDGALGQRDVRLVRVHVQDVRGLAVTQAADHQVGGRQPAHVRALLAQPVGAVLQPLDPVARHERIGQAGGLGGPVPVRAGREVRDRARVAQHHPVHQLRVLEPRLARGHVGRHAPRQRLVAQRQQRGRVVDVDGQHGALRVTVLVLDVVQVEKGGACRGLKPGQHVARVARGHAAVEEQARGDDVERLEVHDGAEVGAARQRRVGGHQLLHGGDAHAKHHRVRRVHRGLARLLVHRLHRSHLLHPGRPRGGGDGGDNLVAQHLPALRPDALHQGGEDLLRDGPLAPAHVEGRLLRQRVKVQRLEHDGGADGLGGRKQAHQQRGAQELLVRLARHAARAEKLVRGHRVILEVRLLGRVEVEEGGQEGQHGDAVGQRHGPGHLGRVVELAQQRGQARQLGEHGRARDQALGRPEARRGPVGEWPLR
mmetsp:Transcript_22801/g.58010  ORF Transcript_22801/g.58010 Transcript_22801/m.58010 type:complete len:530 (-) Transcript_22801:289-1878(-)